ncbi:MAG: DUF2235 domain-containing protein [Pseudonocardiaceae bacterium]
MRHLVVCCDGTWNNTLEEVSDTNVARLRNALAEITEEGTEQRCYYDTGVGAEGGLLTWLLGGLTGAGLSRNVMDAYHWLTTNYEHGDRIALFGFSRGAYTVRSLAGMISACGLIDTACLDGETTWRQIQDVYDRRYRRAPRAGAHWREGLRFTFDPDHADQMPVHFIGVWETIGSLGIPDHLGVLNMLDLRRRYAFHDVKLNPHIRCARHALAMDETRTPFSPTLWDPAPGQDVKQVWFPGSHLDVGGGHLQRGMSDGALRWMIEQAQEKAGLAFHKPVLDQIRPDPHEVCHDDNLSLFGWLAPAVEPLLQPFFVNRPRAVPLIDPDAPDPRLHKSVYERHQIPPIAGGPYRPTRVLAIGQSTMVEVSARNPWNNTGLYLRTGDYTFAARGGWMDAGVWSGPEGITGPRRFSPVETGRLAGTLIGQGEKLFRWMTGNPVANFFFTRRDEEMPWMSLIGVVANDAKAVRNAPNAHEHIAIGTGVAHHVSRDGYLYAFANDAWGFYGNNRGTLRLTVTRTA